MNSVNLRLASLKGASLRNCNLRYAIMAGTDMEVCMYVHMYYVCMYIVPREERNIIIVACLQAWGLFVYCLNGIIAPLLISSLS